MNKAVYQSFEASSEPDKGPERLIMLRGQMRKSGVDAFLIPRADVHQGEYVAPADERLAWLTGFTGSAGFCAVTQDAAGVFVDGRYRVQVKEQTRAPFTPVDWPEVQLADWLKDNLPSGIVGFDPWLHSAREIKSLEYDLRGTGITMKAVDNLIDPIWQDRPTPPMGLARVFDDHLSGETHTAKRTRLAAELKSAGHAAAFISLPDSICWLLNIRGQDVAHNPVVHGFTVLHDDARVDLFMHAQKTQDIRAHLGNEVTLRDPDDLFDYISSFKGSMRLDAGSVPYAISHALSDKAILSTDPVSLPKACKNATELKSTRESHLRDAAAMCRFLAWLDAEPHGTLTEIDAATQLEEIRRQDPLMEEISFDTISAAGPHAALPHYRVTTDSNRTLNAGEVYLVDSGAQYQDGTTDITRTLAIGDQSDAVKRAFTRVLKGMIAISRLRFPHGISGRDIDAFARAALWSAGQDYQHGTGHGVGHVLSVHEGPQNLSRRSTLPFEPGMILSNEPGFYREGHFGIRTENLLIVVPAPDQPDGNLTNLLEFETLTYVPIDRRMILRDMLNSDEIEWLNSYHQTCRDKIHPRLTAAEQVWLWNVTQPL
jgi:Xaa-Pro aminopeptidase